MPVYCDEVVRKALARQMTDNQINDFLLQVEEAMRSAKQAAANPADKALRLQALAEKKRLEGMARRRAGLIQRQRRLANRDLVLTEYAGMEDKGVESLIVGTQYNKKGSHFSVDHIAKGYEEHWLGRLYNGVNALGPGHWRLFRSGKLDRQIAEALWKVERPGDFHGEKAAMEIAKVIHEIQEDCCLAQNKLGAATLKLDGYIVRQSHDQDKIWRAGAAEWKSFVRDRLDWKETADGRFDPNVDAKAADKFLQDLWEAFASGIHEKQNGAGLNNPLASSGNVGSLAAKLNQNRVIHFKDSDAWFDYNERFGFGNLREAVQNGIRKAAGNSGLMRMFGPSPKAGLDFLLKDLGLALKHKGDFEGVKRLRAAAKRLDNEWQTVDGSGQISGNPSIARWSANIRSWNNMTKLGGVLLSSITDIPSFATEFAYHGQGFLRSLGEGLRLVAQGRGSAAQKEILADCGVFFDSMSAELCSRFTGADATGKIAAASNFFFKVNGLSLWTDAWKKSAALMLAHNLGRMKSKAWNDLGHAGQRLLSLYGLEEEGWNLLRAGKLKAADGREYLTPEITAQIPEAEIRNLLQAKKGGKVLEGEIQQYRDELAERLRTLIRDRVSYAVLEPDARTRSILYQGTKPGTAAGEAMRFVLQFKSFPTAFMQKLFGRELLGREATTYKGGLANIFLKDKFGERSGFARMFLMMTLFGYGAMSVKQLLAGKTPHDPANPKTWLAAAVQGGGLGIYGDFLFGDKSRVGSSFYSTLGGPTLSQVEEAQNLWFAIRDGEDAKSGAIRFAMGLMPGNNLFYTRAAFDYLIGYNLFEMLNPGYISRYRRRIKRENGQTFWLEPHKWR